MKKLLLTAALGALSLCATAQGNPPKWDLNGNNIGPNRYLGTNNERDLVFKTHGNEAGRFDINGNLIIGGLVQGLPLERLTLNGNMVALGEIKAEEFTVVNFMKSDRGVLLKDVFCIEGKEAVPGSENRMFTLNGDMYIQSHDQYGFNTILNSTNAGKVGIGTSTPSEKLDVNGNLLVQDQLKAPNMAAADGSETQIVVMDANGQLKMAGLGGILYPQSLCSGGAPVLNPMWANGTNKIYTECPQVNVGIGTATPNEKLDVIGYGRFSGGVIVGNYYTPQNEYPYIMGYDDIITERPWMNFVLPDAAGEPESVFLVENDGSLYATSVRVRFTPDIPVPDYVFQKDYRLMPLSDVKAYVQEHSHLPNVPSEKEFREEGLNVEAMQFKLLEKVEELTLYVIDLEEKSKAQQAEIEALKEELNKQ